MLQSACPEKMKRVKVIGTSRPVPAAPPLVSGLVEHSEELVLLKKSIKAALKECKPSDIIKSIGILGCKPLTGADYDIFWAFKI